MTVRWSWVVGVGAAGAGMVFGFVGGEYSTPDLWTLRAAVAVEDSAIVQLRTEVDSLRAEAEALATDPAAVEREARERFGMLRPGEIMYRIQYVDSSGSERGQ